MARASQRVDMNGRQWQSDSARAGRLQMRSNGCARLRGPILHDRAPEILDECPEVCVYNYPLIPGVGT